MIPDWAPWDRCGRCKGDKWSFLNTQSECDSAVSMSVHFCRPLDVTIQTRTWQGCHLFANTLSVIFCAPGSPGRAGPHGRPTHANGTNPSQTCLSVSVSLWFPPSLHSTVRQPALYPCSLIYFTLCPLFSLSHKTLPRLCECMCF